MCFISLRFVRNGFEWGSAVGSPAPLVGAINRTRDVHHGSDVVHMDVVRVQIGMNVIGNLFRRPTPPVIVTDDQSLPDERLIVPRRPRQAGAAQLIEVVVSYGSALRRRGPADQ